VRCIFKYAPFVLDNSTVSSHTAPFAVRRAPYPMAVGCPLLPTAALRVFRVAAYDDGIQALNLLACKMLDATIRL
jgi:hypothetical protein